jgi:hypothetical protein
LRKVQIREGKDWSGRKDLNLRPPGPEPGALARLRYAPTDTLRRTFSPERQQQLITASNLASTLTHGRVQRPLVFNESAILNLLDEDR